MTGRTILHYKVGEPLGAGGMGEVYLAEDIRLHRPVALKFLPAALRDDPVQRERLLREARAASALRSPNIAAIYDIAEHERLMFIVMEYVQGELLSERIRRGPLEIADAIEIAMQVADTLEEAHARGLVHRDIKSANLIVTERGMVKVLDFGLAKFVPGGALDPGSAVTMTAFGETLPGLVLGTVSYMSPEQALGRSIDERSDLFSLGVVMYEMATGRRPFDGDSVTEVIDRILHQDPTALGDLNPKVPPPLDSLVRKALEKNPADRYQNARELHDALRELRASLSGPTYGQAAGSTVAAIQRGKPGSTVAVITFVNITGEPAEEWIGTGIAETVTTDLSNIRGLTIISRARVFDALKELPRTRGAQGTLDEGAAIAIGRKLGATWIIAGGYQRLGELVRITAQFLDVRTGALVKTVKLDGRIGEIFDLQDRIVYELTQGLDVKLGSGEVAAIERKETLSVEAYELYSRGMMNLRISGRDSLDRAASLLEKAVTIDPAYAAAWAALGAAYELKGSFLGLTDLLFKAIDAERRALALNPRLPQAYVWLGAALRDVGHYDESLAAVKEAVRLDPSDANVHAALARSYWVGKGMIDEGITELQHVIAINPEAGYAHLQLALLYALRGDFERAEAACRHAIELQERGLSGTEGMQIVGAHTRLGYVYYRQGRLDEAIREYGRELEFLSSSDHALRGRLLIELNQKLGAAYLKKGMPSEAAQHFQRAIEAFERRVADGADDPFTTYYIACLYALRGEIDEGLKYLGESSRGLPLLNKWRASVDPDLDNLRGDARFHTLFK